jgi:vancomycin aglycone glucosyltransferase
VSACRWCRSASRRSMVRPSSAAKASRRAAELIAAQFDTIAAAAEGCDAPVATGLALFVARSVAEKLGIRHYVYATFCPIVLPSPHHAPPTLAGEQFPPDVTDNRVLNDLDTQGWNAQFGAAINTHRASIG